MENCPGTGPSSTPCVMHVILRGPFRFIEIILLASWKEIRQKSDRRGVRIPGVRLSDFCRILGRLRGASGCQFGVFSTKNGSLQGVCYNIFNKLEVASDKNLAFSQKLAVTLGASLSNEIVLPVDWFSRVQSVLLNSKTHVKMCVLKTWVGGWTTSRRMHEEVVMDCLFGCHDQQDTLVHYLHCAPLWLLAGEALGVVSPFNIAERLCIASPTVEHCQLLALCFQGYHYAKSLCVGEGESRLQKQDAQRMQTAVQQALRSFVHNFCCNG